MKKIRLAAISAVLVWGVIIGLNTPLYAQVNGAPVPFSAEWGYYDQGERQDSGKYYAGPDAVRVELTSDRAVWHLGPDGGPYAVIYNLKDTVAWILDPTECTYSEQSDIRFGLYWSHRIGHFGNPCPQETRARRIGRDTLQGRSVEKWRCAYPERHHIVVWYDTRLLTPIRIDIDKEFNEYFALTGIIEGPQPETLFALPSEYISYTHAVLMEGEHSCPE